MGTGDNGEATSHESWARFRLPDDVLLATLVYEDGNLVIHTAMPPDAAARVLRDMADALESEAPLFSASIQLTEPEPPSAN